ncbi:alpha/beta hydrolase-fold protein [Aureibacter tunicatorum]|uniref:Alpha/beta hydrolase n=1 Tax=Aureibacter tunicatorum TaxID=866807 RepID=A0AAE3XKJ1_9BACT|nr:alpha/beta hydrolase-fold protein [Aureibacter tunicatorum]MDR6239511.1 hypothetical protein [Aureibacter tunicatorum]BDD03988.1 hypothetical protein AUTU_14710 [Aureibacter tunicatorum]
MKKTLFICALLFLFACNLLAQSSTIGLDKNQITVGIVDSIYSNILQEKRPIWISIPESAENSQKRFPVIYVLDGTAHFYSTVGMVHQLSVANGNNIIPEMIVVGIPNTDRVRDLTPSKVPYLASSGGAENFSSFLENELIPYIDSKYQTTPYRTLVGHSWAGLFTLNTLIHHPAIFDNYVAIDPSIRWNNLSFFEEASHILKSESFKKKSLYLAVANRLPKGLDLNTVLEDTLSSSEHMRTILAFKNICEQADQLNFDWKFYLNDNHNGVPFAASYDAVRSLFDWYNFDEEFLFQEGLGMNVDDLMTVITNHFENIADHFNYSFPPPESSINRYGDIMLSVQQDDKAFALYNLNINNYPKSYRAYDAMGDFYRSQSNKEKATEFYKKSLSLHDTEVVRRKLDNLSESQ